MKKSKRFSRSGWLIGGIALLVAVGGVYAYQQLSIEFGRSSAALPVFRCVPSQAEVKPGQPVIFSVTGQGTPPAGQQWKYDWTAQQGSPRKGFQNTFTTTFSPADQLRHVYTVSVKYGPYTASCPITVSAMTASSLPPPGILWRTNAQSDIATYGNAWFLSGGRGLHFAWCDVEPSPGVYNFAAIDAYIRAWKSLGKVAVVGISATSGTQDEDKTCAVANHPNAITTAPSWIYQAPYNVHFLDMPQKGEPDNSPDRMYWPVYWDAPFIQRYTALMGALTQHINQVGLQNSVAWIEPLPGRDNTLSVATHDIAKHYVTLFKNSPAEGKDYNNDGTVDVKDFELF